MSQPAGALAALSEGTSWIPSNHWAVVAPALVHLASSSGLCRHQTHTHTHIHSSVRVLHNHSLAQVPIFLFPLKVDRTPRWVKPPVPQTCLQREVGRSHLITVTMLWCQGLCRRKHNGVTKNPTSSQFTNKDSHRSFSGGSENISEASRVCMNVQECLHSGRLRGGPYKFPNRYSFFSEIDSKLISCGISKDKRRKIGED